MYIQRYILQSCWGWSLCSLYWPSNSLESPVTTSIFLLVAYQRKWLKSMIYKTILTHSIWSVILQVFTSLQLRMIQGIKKNQIHRYDLLIDSLIESVARWPSETDHHHTSKNITKDKLISDFTLERGGGSSYRRLQRVGSIRWTVHEEGQSCFLNDGERCRYLSASNVQKACLLLFLFAAAHD